jgi:hypothetical protein
VGYLSFIARLVPRPIPSSVSRLVHTTIVRRQALGSAVCLFLAATLSLFASGCSVGLAGSAASPRVPLSHSVAISWTASTSNVIGYYVYRSTQSGGPYALLEPSVVSGTSFVDTNVLPGQTYFYVATSIDAGGNESTFSAEVSATIPTP